MRCVHLPSPGLSETADQLNKEVILTTRIMLVPFYRSRRREGPRSDAMPCDSHSNPGLVSWNLTRLVFLFFFFLSSFSLCRFCRCWEWSDTQTRLSSPSHLCIWLKRVSWGTRPFDIFLFVVSLIRTEKLVPSSLCSLSIIIALPNIFLLMTICTK